MRRTSFFIMLIWVGSVLPCVAQSSNTRIEIITPSIEQEATSIWRTINDIVFLECQGYQIHLPEGALMDSLVSLSKEGNFGNNNYSEIYSYVENSVFNDQNYEQALLKIQSEMDHINQMINKVDAAKDTWDWAFNVFEKYQIMVTLFGTGGSYDPDEGTITLMTNAVGEFMNYDNPANTIMHEIIHMGLEHSIIEKYNVPHSLKERIVDHVVFLLFKEDLPDYRIQNMGDKSIDPYLENPSDLITLETTVSEWMKR